MQIHIPLFKLFNYAFNPRLVTLNQSYLLKSHAIQNKTAVNANPIKEVS